MIFRKPNHPNNSQSDLLGRGRIESYTTRDRVSAGHDWYNLHFPDHLSRVAPVPQECSENRCINDSGHRIISLIMTKLLHEAACGTSLDFSLPTSIFLVSIGDMAVSITVGEIERDDDCIRCSRGGRSLTPNRVWNRS